jgi:hypothetical protein
MQRGRWVHSGLISFEVIVLLPKKSNSLQLVNKRPITLLTSKYNIFAKIRQLRLTAAAQAVLSWNLTAFLPSRSIHHSVLFCPEALHFADLNQIPLVFLEIDLWKA